MLERAYELAFGTSPKAMMRILSSDLHELRYKVVREALARFLLSIRQWLLTLKLELKIINREYGGSKVKTKPPETVIDH